MTPSTIAERSASGGSARESMHRVTQIALDIMAASGIMRDHPIEKLFRDGMTKHHGSGPNSLLRLRIMPT